MDIICVCIVVFFAMTFTRCRALQSTPKSYFERIGSPKYISAPMVEHSDLPWRLLVKSNGADIAFTQMINAKLFASSKTFRARVIDWDDYSHISGDEKLGNRARLIDRNLIVQFAGDDIEALVEAGKLVHHDAAAIDLNLGCPQKIAKKGHYGSYLLPDTELVISLLSGMVKRLDCPITAKIRILPTEQETLSLCKAIEDCGISMLTIHGRERTACKSNIGSVDWDIIRKAKHALSIPVIANGGISCRADALRCLEYTGADGVMSSEALLENPKMFSEEGDRLFREDYARAQLQTAREFLQLTEDYYLRRHSSRAPLMLRSHFFKILAKLLSGPRNKDVQLKVGSATKLHHYTDILNILDERISNINYSLAVAEEYGLLGKTGFYLRHRSQEIKNPDSDLKISI